MKKKYMSKGRLGENCDNDCKCCERYMECCENHMKEMYDEFLKNLENLTTLDKRQTDAGKR